VALSETAGTMVAYGNFAGRVGVLDWAGSAVEIATIQLPHPINRVAWSPGSQLLAVADYEGLLRLYTWDGAALTEAATYDGHDGAIKDFSWVDDQHLVTVSTDRTSRLISAEGRMIRVFTGHGELINAVSVTRVGPLTVLATASRDRTVRLHDLHRGTLLGVLTGHDESVKALAWRGDGTPTLLTGGYDFTGRVWKLDPRTWRPNVVQVLESHRNAVSSVCWLGERPVTAGWDARVFLWHRDGKAADELPLRAEHR